MTVKLIALYKQPEDGAAFLRHYEEIHMPLVAKTPHLLKTVHRPNGSHPTADEPAATGDERGPKPVTAALPRPA